MANLKASVLKADKAASEKLATELLTLRTKSGAQVCSRRDIDSGFEILAPYKNQDGTWARNSEGKIVRKVVFRYSEAGNDLGLKVIEWDADFVTIPDNI